MQIGSDHFICFYWGSDRSLLLTLYRSLVRSKLDYGYQWIGQWLFSLHIRYYPPPQASRSWCLPYHSCSEPSCCCEWAFLASSTQLSIPSLYVKNVTIPSNPAFEYTLATSNELIYARSTRSKPAIGLPEGPSFSACGIKAHSLFPLPLSPLWFLLSPIVHLHLHEHSKQNTSSLVFLTLYGEYVSSHLTLFYGWVERWIVSG